MDSSSTRRASWTRRLICSVWRMENFWCARWSPQLSVFWQTTLTGVVAAITAVDPSWLFIRSTYGRIGVAADLDVLGKRREHPHPTAAGKAAGGLEVQLAAEQLVDELERLLVLHDPVSLTDDPQDGAVVLADGCVVAGDLLAPRLPPVVNGSGIAAVHGDRLTFDPPTETGASIASAIVAGGRSSTAPRPCHGVSRTENIESLLVIPAGIRPFPSGRGPARCGAGRGEGRTPGWRAKLAPPAGSRTARTPHSPLATRAPRASSPLRVESSSAFGSSSVPLLVSRGCCDASAESSIATCSAWTLSTARSSALSDAGRCGTGELLQRLGGDVLVRAPAASGTSAGSPGGPCALRTAQQPR